MIQSLNPTEMRSKRNYQCPYCQKCIKYAPVQSPEIEKEVRVRLAEAMRQWMAKGHLSELGLATRAGVHRSRLRRFLESHQVEGPGAAFFLALYQLEQRFPGFYDPKIAQLLAELCGEFLH